MSGQGPTKDFCPYVGLESYSKLHADYFFGRERDQRVVFSNMCASALTVLYGPTGVGKSSILQAGVAAVAKTEDPRPQVVYFSEWQGDTFLASLKARCVEAVTQHRSEAERLDRNLPFDAFLAELVKCSRQPFLVIMDQFEEYMLYHPEDHGGDTFDRELAKAINNDKIAANFLIALREDAVAALDRFQKRIPHLLRNTLRIEHLSEEQAEAAIRKPLTVYRERFPDGPGATEVDAAVVKEVLAKARRKTRGADGQAGAGQKNPIEVAYLQMVLKRLWEAELKAKSPRLRFATLSTQLGGVEKIVDSYLDDAMRGFGEAELDMCEDLFPLLVTRSGGKFARELDDLAISSKRQTEVKKVEKLLGVLVDRNVLRLLVHPPRYELRHDVLAPSIVGWLTEYGEQHRQRRAQQERRQKARNRTVFSVAVIACAVVVVVVVLAINLAWQKGESESKQRELTRINGLLAQQTQIATDLAKKANASAAAALQAKQDALVDRDKARQSETDALAQKEAAAKAEARARASAREAADAKGRAEAGRKEAEKQAEIARTKTEEAQSYLSKLFAQRLLDTATREPAGSASRPSYILQALQAFPGARSQKDKTIDLALQRALASPQAELTSIDAVALAFEESGPRLLIATSRGQVNAWAFAPLSPPARQEAADEAFHALPDSRALQEIFSPADKIPPLRVLLTPTGSHLFTLGAKGQGTIRDLQAKTEALVKDIALAGERNPSPLALGATGDQLAFLDSGLRPALWRRSTDVSTGLLSSLFGSADRVTRFGDNAPPSANSGAPPAQITRLALSPDGKRLALLMKDGTLVVCDTETGQEKFRSDLRAAASDKSPQTPAGTSRDDPIANVAIANGRYLATAHRSGKIRVLDVDDRRFVAEIARPDPDRTSTPSLTLNAEGTRLVAVWPESDGLVAWTDFPSGSNQQSRYYFNSMAGPLTFDREFQSFACENSGSVSVYRLEKTSDLLAKLDPQAANVPPRLGAEDYLNALGADLVPDLKSGVDFARQGNFIEARADFEAAVRLPGISFDIDAESARIRAAALIGEIADSVYDSLVRPTSAEISQALAKLQNALALDPNVNVPAQVYNSLCWFGSLDGMAASVIALGEKAVRLSPTRPSVHDTRGLARALTGDAAGAIEDFQFYLDNTKDPSDRIEERRGWVRELIAHRPPGEIFTPEVLSRLRAE